MAPVSLSLILSSPHYSITVLYVLCINKDIIVEIKGCGRNRYMLGEGFCGGGISMFDGALVLIYLVLIIQTRSFMLNELMKIPLYK